MKHLICQEFTRSLEMWIIRNHQCHDFAYYHSRICLEENSGAVFRNRTQILHNMKVW
jgi:hypothetical protein